MTGNSEGIPQAVTAGHPDKNPDNKEEAEEKFKSIASVHRALRSRAEGLRPIREEASKDGRGAGAGGFSVDPHEIFKQFFGGESPFGGAGGGNVKFSFSTDGAGGGGAASRSAGWVAEAEAAVEMPMTAQASRRRPRQPAAPRQAGAAGGRAWAQGRRIEHDHRSDSGWRGGEGRCAVGDVVWRVDGAELSAGERLATKLTGNEHTLSVAYMRARRARPSM